MARDALDNELTALVGESYNRAYGVSVKMMTLLLVVYTLICISHCQAIVQVQALSELEEIIQYKTTPDRRQTIKETWWKRLQVHMLLCDLLCKYQPLMHKNLNTLLA